MCDKRLRYEISGIGQNQAFSILLDIMLELFTDEELETFIIDTDSMQIWNAQHRAQVLPLKGRMAIQITDPTQAQHKNYKKCQKK